MDEYSGQREKISSVSATPTQMQMKVPHLLDTASTCSRLSLTPFL